VVQVARGVIRSLQMAVQAEIWDYQDSQGKLLTQLAEQVAPRVQQFKELQIF
jgi:predicted RNA-binding protein Jag